MIRERAFRVEGMDCADCAQRIEGVVSKLKGITSAQVLLSSSKLVVKAASEDLNTGEIIKAVERLGYKIKSEEMNQSVSLYVEGMDCSDEETVIDKKLKSLAGILKFEVNLTSQKLDVSYNPAELSSQSIIKAIAETGMKARLSRPKTKTKSWWADTRVKLIAVSGIFTLTAFILERAGTPHQIADFIYGAAILVGSYFPARMALASLRTRTLNIYTLLVVATIGAIYLGFWDEAALLVLAYTWGAVMETYATDKARGSLRLLMELVPREALVRKNGQEITLPVEEVQIGETIIVRPGERIPLDGVVLTGSSSVDQAPITGESIPVGKAPGEAVFAGSINQRGSLEIRVSKLSQNTTLSRIIRSVETAEAKKSSYQRFAQGFGKVYTPAMFLLALLVAVVPSLFFGQPFTPWFYRALVVLVVSCSCGLALSVPISVLAAVSNAARKGILIKGGSDLEAAGSIDAIVFDKTGTLTIGLPRVTDIIPVDSYTADNILSLAASVESRSEHPLADAILRKAREEGAAIHPLEGFEAIIGLGATGTVDSKVYHVCNARFCERMSIPLDGAAKELVRLENEGKSTMLVLGEKKILGIIAVADQLRPEARDTIAALKKAGIKKVVMLTGDNEGTARAIAAQAGIDEYRSQLLPEDKVEAVKELKRKYGKVVMVGDGVNDAPAMAVADVGIAMGAAGTDVALETAEMALMSDDLSRLPHALYLSRRAVSTIKQNIVASLAIVAIVVTLALAGRISLVPGLLLNEGSALIVMLNGLRLLK